MLQDPSSINESSHRGLTVAMGVTADRRREFLGKDAMRSEDVVFGAAFVGSLKFCCLNVMAMVVSDTHSGLKQEAAVVPLASARPGCCYRIQQIDSNPAMPSRHLSKNATIRGPGVEFPRRKSWSGSGCHCHS